MYLQTLLVHMCTVSISLQIFGARMLCCLCYIQVSYFHFYHSTLLLDLKSEMPPLVNFHLMKSPLCFQIFHQPQTRNPGCRRQHHVVSVKVKCLQISRLIFHSYHNSSLFLYYTCKTIYFRHRKYMKIELYLWLEPRVDWIWSSSQTVEYLPYHYSKVYHHSE